MYKHGLASIPFRNRDIENYKNQHWWQREANENQPNILKVDIQKRQNKET